MNQSSSNLINLLKRYRNNNMLIDDDLLKLAVKYINEIEYIQTILEEELEEQDKLIRKYEIKLDK